LAVGANCHGGASLFTTVSKPPFLIRSPLHSSAIVVVVGVADEDVDEDVDVVNVVGPGVMRQEQPDDTLDAGYCET
ncbi:MAG: hypothetical protein Q9200_001572, partial [Gallowayella weberi]